MIANGVKSRIALRHTCGKEPKNPMRNDCIRIPIEPHFAGKYRIEYDGKYVSLYGLDNRYDMAGLYGAPEGTFDEMVLIPVVAEVRNASPEIVSVTDDFVEIRLF